MSYKVVIHYLDLEGMPSWPRSGAFRAIAAHDTEGGVGEQGAWNTASWMHATAAQRNASYHEFWWFEEATDEFGVLVVVPESKAAGSIAPQPWGDGGPLYTPDALVREALGNGVWDPNYWVYAVSIAGKVADVNRWATNPAFIAGCRRRFEELRAALGVSWRLEHFRFNPRTRSDWGQNLTAALGGSRIEEDIVIALRPVRQQWTTGTGNRTAVSAMPSIAPGGQFYLAGPGQGEPKYFTSPEKVWTIAETVDGDWRLVEYGSETLWMSRNNLRPIAGTRNPATGFGSPSLSAVTGFTEAQVKERIAAATKPLLNRISEIKRKSAATAADIADD